MKKYSVPDNPEIISKLISNGFKIVGQSVDVDEDEIYKVEEILFSKPQVSVVEPEVKTENKEAEKKTEKKDSLKSSEPKKKYKIKKKNKK